MPSLRIDEAITARYDSDAVRQVLARASEIEQKNQEQAAQETLTATQIEALGKELGLSPDAIRRALGEMSPGAVVSTPQAVTHAPVSQLRQKDLRSIALSGAAVAMINAVFLFFLLRSVSWVASVSPSAFLEVFTGLLVTFMVYGLSSLMAFRHGWRTADRRAGMLSGAWGGLCSAIGVYCAFRFAAAAYPVLQDPFGMLHNLVSTVVHTPNTLLFAIVAAVLVGAAGGMLRNWSDSLRRAEER